jgi:hypothetical protein
MEITEAQAGAMDVLAARGYAITNFYGDGAVRMIEPAGRSGSLALDEALALFVRTDGTVSSPMPMRAHRERLELENAGLTVRDTLRVAS